MNCKPFTPALRAAAITVSPGGSIRTAINAVVAGDTLRVLPGTYVQKVRVCEKSGTASAFITTKDRRDVALATGNLRLQATSPVLNAGGPGRFEVAHRSGQRLDGAMLMQGDAVAASRMIADPHARLKLRDPDWAGHWRRT